MSRDTQFTGFAKALTDELITYLTSRGGLTLDEIEQEWRKVIARRAYDLAFHAIDNSRSNDMEDWQTDKIMPYIPDMTELPKEQEPEWDSEEIQKALKEHLFPKERQNMSGEQFDQEYLGKFVE